MSDLVKRDPFRTIFAWPRFLDDFDEDFGQLQQRGLKIYEDPKNIYAEAVVAGIPSKNVDIEIEDGVLTIKAEVINEEKEKNEYKSSSYRYYYTCALSGGQWNKASADVQNGVVKVTIPKLEAARPKKITVKAKSSE